jgi:hypothetical protein
VHLLPRIHANQKTHMTQTTQGLKSAIAEAELNRIKVRGHDLCDELLGQTALLTTFFSC